MWLLNIELTCACTYLFSSRIARLVIDEGVRFSPTYSQGSSDLLTSSLCSSPLCVSARPRLPARLQEALGTRSPPSRIAKLLLTLHCPLQILRKLFPRVPILAVTATCSRKVLPDLLNILGMQSITPSTSTFPMPFSSFP